MKNYTKSFIIGGLILAALLLYFTIGNTTPKETTNNSNNVNNSAQVSNIPQPPDDEEGEDLPPKVMHVVPFSSQAPTGNWSDPRQQDGCEETSILMAAKWAKGEQIGSARDVEREILALSALAEKMFGAYADSSAQDTWTLYKEYSKLDKGKAVKDPSLEDIKKELAKGNLVLVPADGRKLNNPNFTNGGPDRHFLVILGYDEAAKRFITNDPGTRNGKNYPYSYSVLMEAMLDYPTGNHLQTFKDDTAMIVIGKA